MISGAPIGRLEPCHAVNPELWRMYCAYVGRDASNVADHWTERDVIMAIAARTARISKEGEKHETRV